MPYIVTSDIFEQFCEAKLVCCKAKTMFLKKSYSIDILDRRNSSRENIKTASMQDAILFDD